MTFQSWNRNDLTFLKSLINNFDKNWIFVILENSHAASCKYFRKFHPWTFPDHNLTHIYHQILEMTIFLLNKLWNLQHSKMSKLFWNCNLESKQMWSRHKRRYCRSYNKTKELFQYSLNKNSFVTSSDDVSMTSENEKSQIADIGGPTSDCVIWFLADKN